MRTAGIVVIVLASAIGACGGSYPQPTQRMANAQGSVRSAQELGMSAATPQAQLHLRLAQEEIDRAHAYLEKGDNKKADFMLIRAQSDADLAVALARERTAQVQAQQAQAQVNAMRTSQPVQQNQNQGNTGAQP